MTNRLWFWTKVPDGSTLEFGVSPADGLHARARLDRIEGTQQGETTVVGHDRLTPAPFQTTTDARRNIGVDLTIDFAGDVSATISARVLRPDGTVHQDSFREAFEGSAGDEYRLILSVAS